MNPLTIEAIDHVSVIITDVARSRQFYGEVLGLQEVPGPRTFDFVVVWYDLGGGDYLHLLLKPQADSISGRHFALRVADLTVAREQIARHGVAIDETTPIPGAERFFVRDPDGNRIEVIHWSRPYNPAVDGRSLV